MSEQQKSQSARVPQHEAAALYDRLAWIYDLWGHLTESKARDRVLDLARLRNGQQVLEVAVGTGLLFERLVRGNPDGRNVGIDLSAGMLAKAERRLRKARLSNYQLSVGDATAIEQRDASFDVVLNNYMFDLLDEDTWDDVLDEFHRVLRPGGVVVLANMTFGERPGSGIYERLYRLSPSLMGGCRGVRLSGVLERHGFSVRTREYLQQLLFPSEVILASKRD